MSSYDVLIVGGGVVGASVAAFQALEPAFDGRVAVVDRDPGQADSSTGRSVGGMRLQFSTPENVEMSKFGVRFVREAPRRLAVDGVAPELNFVEGGYLFLATAAGLPALEASLAVQRACGVETRRLSPAELARRFPWLEVADLAAASLGERDEGWLDPMSLRNALAAKARSLGVRFLDDAVVAVERDGPRVTAARLAGGDRLSCGVLVDAAGPRAAEIAALAGVDDLPVHPRKRQVHVFECPQPPSGCPLVIDPSGAYFRPEGDRFLCGISPPEGRDPDCLDLRADPGQFEEILWPLLARRVPAFDRVRRTRSWAGHYAVNVVDRNAIVGAHPLVRNLLFANGFSGHGLQQAPAVGRALAELLTFGAYRTLDLRRFGFERFAAGRPVRELRVV